MYGPKRWSNRKHTELLPWYPRLSNLISQGRAIERMDLKIDLRVSLGVVGNEGNMDFSQAKLTK